MTASCIVSEILALVYELGAICHQMTLNSVFIYQLPNG